MDFFLFKFPRRRRPKQKFQAAASTESPQTQISITLPEKPPVIMTPELERDFREFLEGRMSKQMASTAIRIKEATFTIQLDGTVTANTSYGNALVNAATMSRYISTPKGDDPQIRIEPEEQIEIRHAVAIEFITRQNNLNVVYKQQPNQAIEAKDSVVPPAATRAADLTESGAPII